MEFDEGCDEGNVDLGDDINPAVMNTADYALETGDI